MSRGFSVTQALAGLAATSFTWSSGFTDNRARLNDGVMDELVAGSATPQASGQTLTIDLGAAVSLSGFALLNHNLAAAAGLVAVTYASDAGFTTGTGTAKAASTLNVDEPYQKDTVLQFPAVSRRYWRLTFTHTGTLTVTLGELLALTTIGVLSRDPVYGSGESERYVQNRNESRTGNVRSTFVGGPIRTVSLPFVDLQGTSQRNEVMAMWRATRGGAINVLFIDFIESTATAATSAALQCLWGKFQDTLGWTENDVRLFGIDSLTLVGLGREVGS
jgi:hypothetical protein